MIWAAGLVIGSVFCAIQAIRAARLLHAAIWLAACSALVSVLLFMLGAREAAVIELSVGAGLVTVLFVFAIAIAGETAPTLPSVPPRSLAWGLAVVAAVLLGFLVLPATPTPSTPSLTALPSFANVFWQQRSLDSLVQVVVIFAGALSVLGLLATAKTGTHQDAVSSETLEPLPAAPELEPGDRLDDEVIAVLGHMPTEQERERVR